MESHEYSAVEALLRESGFPPRGCFFALLKGDGSDRRFIRASSQQASIMIILPALNRAEGKKEACSGWRIGRHLQEREVPVPEMIAYDPETGSILCEDLGEILLHHQISQLVEMGELVRVYKEAVDLLVNMQINGYRGFKAELAWDNPLYDRQTMLQRESGYFFDSCCRKIMGIENMPQELEAEFILLSEFAGGQSTEFFLHRDFQSRNIMIKNGRLRLIDFQGGRFGPLGYDLASLLIDPYAGLSSQVRDVLLEYYLDRAAELIPLDRAGFVEGYYWLAMQRNLQILGAFAFLSTEKGKPFFREYLRPAARSLLEMLARPAGSRFSCLQALVAGFENHLGV